MIEKKIVDRNVSLLMERTLIEVATEEKQIFVISVYSFTIHSVMRCMAMYAFLD